MGTLVDALMARRKASGSPQTIRELVGGEPIADPRPEAGMSAYTPTLTERLTDAMAKGWYGDNRAGTEKAEKLMDVLSFSPVGAAAGMYDAGRSLGEGDYMGAGMNLGMAMAPGPPVKGFRAWHTSPYDFDKFSSKHIGTGEGNQTYGHGLYVGDNPKVSGPGGEYWHSLENKVRIPQGGHAELEAKGWLKSYDFDREKALEAATQAINDIKYPRSDEIRSRDQRVLDLLASNKQIGPRVYDVHVNADPSEFLQWDKPLNEQLESIKKLGFTGDTDMRTMAKTPEGAKQLLDAGIPGIRYLDQGSRGIVTSPVDDVLSGIVAKTGSKENAIKQLNSQIQDLSQSKSLKAILEKRTLRNALDLLEHDEWVDPRTFNSVIFDDKFLTIMRKFGLAGLLPAGLGAAAALQQPQDGQQ